jgi:sulfofructose kinase
VARRFPARPRNAPRILCAGSITYDHVFTVPAPLAVGQKQRATSLWDIGGGLAANAAVAISRLGGRATLLGVVGADAVGDVVVEELRAERVDVEGIRRLTTLATPESIVIVQPDGARTIVTRAGIDLDRVEPPTLPAGEFNAVLVDARWPDATRAALAMAQRVQIPGVVDVDRLPDDRTLLDDASHLVFSESAMLELCATDDLADGMRSVAADTGAEVSVTLGERGVTWLDGDDLRHLDAFDVDAVDTTGAGDVFHGAFTLALAQQMTEFDAFRFASAAAALKCSRPGARAGVPDRAEVDGFLRSADDVGPG